MAYVPNNIQVYMAAYAGALGGMGASDRILISSNPSKYSGIASVAGAYAQQFDTTWGNANATQLDVFMIEALSEDVWLGRAVVTTFQTTRPIFYANYVNAIIAAIQAGDTYVTEQGITPPDPGGGGDLPALPVIDGTYNLQVTEGVGSWVLTGFAPSIALASGGNGPFLLGAPWTPKFNLTPAANSAGITAASLIDSLANNVNVLGDANPLDAPQPGGTYNLIAAGTVTVHGSMTKAGVTVNTGNISATWGCHTYSGVGDPLTNLVGVTAVLNGINQDIHDGGGGGVVATLIATAGVVTNPGGQVINVNPAAQYVYDLVPHTANAYTYTDQNQQPFLMNARLIINVTNENGATIQFDLYQSQNQLNSNYQITRVAH